MNISKKAEGSKLTIVMEGRLDTTTAPELESYMSGILSGAEPVKELVIDMEKLEYVSSAGLRVLLSLQKAMNKQGSMKVTNLNEIVNEIFEVTGFSDIFTIE